MWSRDRLDRSDGIVCARAVRNRMPNRLRLQFYCNIIFDLGVKSSKNTDRRFDLKEQRIITIVLDLETL